MTDARREAVAQWVDEHPEYWIHDWQKERLIHAIVSYDDAETRALREELDDLRGAYHDMRAMGLPDVFKAQAVLDAALAWENDLVNHGRLRSIEYVLRAAIRAYRAAKEGAA